MWWSVWHRHTHWLVLVFTQREARSLPGRGHDVQLLSSALSDGHFYLQPVGGARLHRSSSLLVCLLFHLLFLLLPRVLPIRESSSVCPQSGWLAGLNKVWWVGSGEMELEDALLIHLFPSDLQKPVQQLQRSTLVRLGILFGQAEGGRVSVALCFCS